MRPLHPLFWLLPLIVFSLACVGCSGSVPGAGTIRVTGRLVDAETGEPVSRETLYIHASNDATGEQVSLEPADSSDFALHMTAPSIRLRIPDLEHRYELYEEDLVAEAGVLDVEVRLTPTHWIRLHGQVRWRDDAGQLRPLESGNQQVSKALISLGERHLDWGGDGHYSVLVPRELKPFSVVNSGYQIHPKEVDLRGDLGDEYELDLVFKK